MLTSRLREFCQTEVSDFDAPSGVDQNIFGLDITMHNAFVMGVLQRLADLRND